MTGRRHSRRALQAEPSKTLPLMLREGTPPIVALFGLAAIIGAVTSSFSASILSAGSMVSWNCGKRLLRPDLTVRQMAAIVRASIALLGVAAILMALEVQSVQALWFFTSDLVFVLLFPQLVFALFDRKANLAARSPPSPSHSSCGWAAANRCSACPR